MIGHRWTKKLHSMVINSQKALGYPMTHLTITHDCHLDCDTCPLKQASDGTILSAPGNVKVQSSPLEIVKGLLTQKLIHPTVRLTGANPLRHPDLPKLLTLLNEHNIKIQCATPGLSSYEVMESLLPKIDTLLLFLPKPTESGYREYTHGDYFQDVLSLVALAKESHTRILLVTHIDPSNIADLPDLYEIGYNTQCPLIITYNKNTLTQDEIAHIKRFKSVPNAWVIHTPHTVSTCYASPPGWLPPWIKFRPSTRYQPKKKHA